MEYFSGSDEETEALGKEFGSQLKENTIVCFSGDLGAGKTTFIRGIVAAHSKDFVNSPTFVYLNIYNGSFNIYHFDLYRLHNVDEFLSMGFDEFFFAKGICCVEWPERIEPILPKCLYVRIYHQNEHQRRILIEDSP